MTNLSIHILVNVDETDHTDMAAHDTKSSEVFCIFKIKYIHHKYVRCP